MMLKLIQSFIRKMCTVDMK